MSTHMIVAGLIIWAGLIALVLLAFARTTTARKRLDDKARAAYRTRIDYPRSTTTTDKD